MPLTLVTPVDTPPGRYPWRLDTGSGPVTIGWVDVIGSALPEQVAVIATPSAPLTATFGDPGLARLLGYDVESVQQPGATMALTLHWQAAGPSTTSYKIFTHVIGPDGRVAAQGDAFPLQGDRPTTTWRPGEMLVDQYAIPLDPALPAGRYELKIGFYDPVTGVRLPVTDASGQLLPDGQMVLTAIDVTPSER